MPVRVKVVLAGTSLTNYAASASGRVRYYIDLAGSGDPSADVLNQAIRLCPQIGQQKDFSAVNGAPATATVGVNGFPTTRSTHIMRVAGHATGSVETKSGQKHFIDTLYESRPRPIIEMGASALSQSTNTYLTSDGTRKQMVLDWTAPAGIYGPGVPPEALPYLKTPVSGSRMNFGSTVRISSVWYNDELSQNDILKLQSNYSTVINQGTLFYTDDARCWLCSSIGSSTSDGGYTTRLTGEFVFNPLGWDTIAMFTVPQSNQLALLSPEVQAAISRRLSAGTSVPDPYLPNKGGAGRWPQQYAVLMDPVVGYLSQGIIFRWPAFDQLNGR